MERSALRTGGRTIPVSDFEDILYPGGHFTKARVIDYYTKVDRCCCLT